MAHRTGQFSDVLPDRGSPGGRVFALVLLSILGACHRAAPAPSAQPNPYAESATTPAPQATPAAPTPPAASVPATDPYHPAPRDTVEVPLYRAWQQYMLQCARCHGEDAQGSSFGPSLLQALKPDGDVPSREEFLHVLSGSRSEKGMPSAEKMGIDSVYFAGLYDYLKGRSDGRLHGGRPARRES